MTVRVVDGPFDPWAELAAFCRGRTEAGAVASFTGLVRGEHGGERILAMTLEHYPGMTERQLARLETEARARWPLADVLVVHRVGRMLPGEPIVLVATASAHRAAALEACAFLIDWLKTKAPFWKLEETPSGERWVQARSEDERAAARWER
ncbi:MAG: molybdenum cofactor biosynthesis protein MoaE [Geminicoccaceae bacterium]|nr:molybdenum cofactor biosynthesis protein MoaE [Geminicoccaceae bacterium]MDW8125676.1 molybdenum cofactor biosynthesis protein MoaE [Geminicoccaceae bacterium]